MLLVFLNVFIGAVVITELLHDSDDEMILEMFGRLQPSMYHLFAVMVDGLDAVHISGASNNHGEIVVITECVLKVYPRMWIFWVIYTLIGTISLIALAPAIFIDLNLRDAALVQERLERDAWERKVDT